MAQTKEEKSATRRRKRAVARTQALGKIVHADKSTAFLRRRIRRTEKSAKPLRGVMQGLDVTRDGQGACGGQKYAEHAVVATTSNFYTPAERLAEAINAALDVDTALASAPGPVTTPDLPGSIPTLKGAEAAMAPDMLAMVKNAQSPRWKRNRETAIRKYRDRVTTNEASLISEDGKITTRRYFSQRVTDVAARDPKYVEFLLGVESTMTPKARRLALMALAVAKRAKT